MVKTKRITKHSKRFERTQTGCLQCRQKKKKCDGKRPTCQSCEKKGISCDFPANIRIFQYQGRNSTEKKAGKAIEVESEKVIEFEEVEAHNHDHEDEQQPILPSIDDETKSTLNTLSKKIEEILEHKDRRPSILTARSDSVSSLISASDSDSDYINSIQPSTPPSGESSTYQISESQRATNVIHEGGSISTILDKMTIDLIKSSINNLQYIDFEKKKIIPKNTQFVKNQSLGFLDDFVPDELIFKPDEYLSFD